MWLERSDNLCNCPINYANLTFNLLNRRKGHQHLHWDLLSQLYIPSLISKSSHLTWVTFTAYIFRWYGCFPSGCLLVCLWTSESSRCWKLENLISMSDAEDIREPSPPHRGCAKPNQTLCIKYHRPGMPKTARLCLRAWQRMWGVHWYSTAICFLKLTLKRVMLKKSNTV